MINAANGFDIKDDDLPDRFFIQPGSSGNKINIPPINRDDFIQARKKYYTIRGLDSKGLPKKEKAEALGLFILDR
jgi:aldehyde:ferredoxin oxidoreductase